MSLPLTGSRKSIVLQKEQQEKIRGSARGWPVWSLQREGLLGGVVIDHENNHKIRNLEEVEGRPSSRIGKGGVRLGLNVILV